MSKLNQLDVLNIIPEIRYTVTLPVSGKTIEVEPYRHGNVKSILLLIEDFKSRKKGHAKKSLNSMRNIVASAILPDVTGEKIDIMKMHIADFVYVMNYIKSVSSGETSKFYFRCCNPECKHPKEFDFVLDDCEVKNLENKNIKTVDIKFEEIEGRDIVLHVKPFLFETYYKNAKFFGKEFEEGDEATRYYASFIEAIESNGQMSDILKQDVVVKFLDKLFEKYVKILVDYINDSPGIKWYQEFDCEKCGTFNKAKLEDPTDFFV